MLDKYNKKPYIYQAKKGYDTSIQDGIVKEKINLMGATVVDIEIEVKMKISRTKYLENRIL